MDLIHTRNIVTNMSSLTLNDLKIITIFSLNHVHQAINSCKSIRANKELSNTTIIAYVFDDTFEGLDSITIPIMYGFLKSTDTSF
uniref:Uncharacterized protein n=1 Tax=Acrobeloides nanus TaxID=290746 RepID=A0A914D4E4_9BILA